MPVPSRSLKAAALTAVAALAAALAPTAAVAATPGSVGTPVVRHDAGPGTPPMIERGTYDYAPTVMYDEAARLYRMWWCGGIAGDHVLYAESSSLEGPWHSRLDYTPHSFDIALGPSADPEAFDFTHTCDPSVIKVAGTWYLYYGGANRLEPGATTRIGLATSPDGVTWTRANGGQAILSPAREPALAVNQYGAGQPSVTHVDGLFHLVYTDTTGRGGNQRNGAGQYVLRSADPTFQTGVEELGATGWGTRYPHRATRHSLLEAFSTDVQFSRALSAFVVAESRTNPDRTKSVRLHYFAKDLLSRLPGSPVVLPADWAEGTALVGRPSRRLAAPRGGVQRIEVVRPLGPPDPFTWRLYPLVADLPVTRPTR